MKNTIIEGALETPLYLDEDGAKIWLEQQVWGHRFYNDQTPWLLVLEAIGLMGSRARNQNVVSVFEPKPGEHENFKYDLTANRRLRQIIFADRHIDEVAEEHVISDSSLWAKWFDKQGKNADQTFGYLRDRFTQFSSFRNAVALIRGSEIEPLRKRRLTSRHFAPRGPAMLCGDYGEAKKGDKVNKDRRFFARGGELLYLMLNRSGKTNELEGLVRERLLSENSRWNRLTLLLSPPATSEASVEFGNIGYLPLEHHRTYEHLGEDWAAILSLKALPDDSVAEPLMRLSGLAVIRYIVERSAEMLQYPRPVMPIDMMGPNTAGVRKLSKDAYTRYRDMSRRVVEQIVENFVASPEWHQARQMANPMSAIKSLLQANYNYEPDDIRVDTLHERMKQDALDIHNGHLGLVVGFYSEQIGLAPQRQASGRWFVFSDALIEALVLANVSVPMELEAFLDKLSDKYGFVIGTEVAARAYGAPIYHQQIKANQKQFEERLRVLGLAKRLSDDCAFVTNPFWVDEVAQ